jgi:SAM-dependent methyltransferase
MKSILRTIIQALLSLVPIPVFIKLIDVALAEKLARGDARQRMTALLRHKNLLDVLLAQAGTDFDDGSHVKQRLMAYRDFFVDNLDKGETVLDVGCGGGELARSLATQAGASVTAIDIDPGNIERAQNNCAGTTVTVVHGDAQQWEPSQPVETLVLSNVLEHIEHRIEFLRRLFEKSQARRALIRVPLYERDWTVPMRQELGIEWRLDNTHYTEYLLPEFHQEMEEAELIIDSLEIRWCEIWAVVRRGD